MLCIATTGLVVMLGRLYLALAKSLSRRTKGAKNLLGQGSIKCVMRLAT